MFETANIRCLTNLVSNTVTVLWKGHFASWTPCIVENCLRQELGYIVLMTAVSIKYRKSRCIGETYGKYKMCIFCVFRGKYVKTPEKKFLKT